MKTKIKLGINAKAAVFTRNLLLFIYKYLPSLLINYIFIKNLILITKEEADWVIQPASSLVLALLP
jgi:hypothetical protein